ncbi:family 43 glycosylhydrolase [Undibacterium sp. Ji50W]|uniref:family 43 glycosylhydrolase n=1 Tax=Undibacterium sp. Ji50W TaxID=3413041 RepID=UPI003BF040FD
MKRTLIRDWPLFIILMVISHFSVAQTPARYHAIHSGIPWFDNRGLVVSAHGANIVKDKDTYYLFGEAHTDAGNAFAGFNCYSSKDLYNWRFESIALPVQAAGDLGLDTVGERPKVMKSPSTGEYVMFMHVDALDYKNQFVGYATSKNITGPYTYRGPLLNQGKPIKKWDMGSFQDKDGAGYVLLHGGDIYKLTDDYTSVSEQVNQAMTPGFESPALFRKDDMYYFLGSDLTGWERNDNYYFTATSLKGPWTRRGFIAPEGTLTWNSQVTFVLPIEGSQGTTYMFMGDRWSFPRQASAATYVWQALTVDGASISIPHYQQAWQIDSKTGTTTPVVGGKHFISNTDKSIVYTGTWQHETTPFAQSISDVKDAAFSVKFSGRQIGVYSLATPDGGYARVSLRNSKGETVLSSIVDMYSKYPVSTLKFMSPLIPKDSYTLTVSVLREHWSWTSKKKIVSGSSGYAVSLEKMVVSD